MKSSWTNGLDAQKKAEISSAFDASGLLRERLIEILKKNQEANRKNNLKEGNYSNANWAYQQADSVGYQRALEEIINIL